MANALFADMKAHGATLYVVERKGAGKGRRDAAFEDERSPLWVSTRRGTGDRVLKAVFETLEVLINYSGVPAAIRQFFTDDHKKRFGFS